MENKQFKKSNKSNPPPKWVRISVLRHPVNVRPATLVEKAGLKNMINNIINKMLVCEDGIHRGEFIAPHKTDKGWHNILTFLHRDEALEHIKQGVFRGL